MEDERLALKPGRSGAGVAMNRGLGVFPWSGWASRAHGLPRVPARHLAIARRGLLVLGVALAALVWLISVGVLIHELVSWWAEFAVQRLNTAIEGPPGGW